MLLSKLGIILMCGVVLTVASPAFFVLPAIGFALFIISRTAARVNLEYSFDSGGAEECANRLAAWQILMEGVKEWQVIQGPTTADTRTNAEVEEDVNRMPCSLKQGTPYYIKTNVDCIQLKLRDETLLFLPDKVFIIRKDKVVMENYSDVQFRTGQANFVESEAVPSDAKVVGNSWRYTNSNGTPDRRYPNNRQLPVCLYGVVRISSLNGLNVELQVSNVQKSQGFGEIING
jgi:hypothetical protein